MYSTNNAWGKLWEYPVESVTNKSLLRRAKIRRQSDIVAESRLRLAGHILRMPDSRHAYMAFNWTPACGRRRRGRPRETYATWALSGEKRRAKPRIEPGGRDWLPYTPIESVELSLCTSASHFERKELAGSKITPVSHCSFVRGAVIKIWWCEMENGDLWSSARTAQFHLWTEDFVINATQRMSKGKSATGSQQTRQARRLCSCDDIWAQI